MSLFMDLNLPFTADKKRLKTLLETAAHLGFSTVAINYVHKAQSKGKKEIPKPTPLDQLVDELPIVQGRSRPIKILNRLTILVTDSNHYRTNAAEYKAYDILAVHPTTEKLFHAACMTFDVDIICITITERLPFFFKRAPINAARERGVMFEVCYAAAIRDSTMRRYTLTNGLALVERNNGKNVIISSGTDKALELRGPYDIANLAQLFGMSEAEAKDGVSSNCRSVLLHAETRKTASGIIYTVKTPKDTEPKETDTDTVSMVTDEPPSAKKQKTSAETDTDTVSMVTDEPPPAKKQKTSAS
ncbi:ribonuclease P protein subunit p30 [Gadus chalcogrammus]|uniref:ribonuclease P protein subunit p30 n=1 Tax=Gadus chalcogrammus TaxID=1042646 RepID=UPI0024C4DBA2|nr:ribonuclease P protein subunit p30 [Gadus chalcogrammus]